jgi:hypothetical protein
LAGVASVGMATLQAAWGVAGVRLRGGVVEGGLQGGARSLGVDGGGVVVNQRERETLAGFSLGLPSFPSMPNANDKQTGFSEAP